jgi:ParB-like chromosome segregation protein Spo0J
VDDAVRIAFERRVAVLPLATLLPLRAVPDAIKASVKYRRIARSIGEVGLIEPLVVARTADQPGRYLLLDGHLRHAILADQGTPNARCLMADDDETFTYNKRINRLATIQEHYMIVRAIERGVPEDKLARALDVDVAAIRRRRTLLSGIAPEVVDMLKDKSINPGTLDVLRKMRPMRQMEAAEVMAAAGNYTASYAKALLAATKQTELVKSDQPKRVSGLTGEQMLRMEREMETLQRDLKSVEGRYGDDTLHLVIAAGYVAKLVSNRSIKRFLETHHPEILTEFTSIIAASSLDQTNAAR